MKVKSIRIKKINSDGSITSKTVNPENEKKHLESLNKVNIDNIIIKIERIKQKTSTNNKKETPDEYLLRKLRNLIDRRNRLLSSFINLGDDILKYSENEIIEYYKKYLIEESKLKQSNIKKPSGDRFGIESNNSILSINTKRNKS